jgi:phosphopantothenoylcysteine decarboxylase/phosphopantothenate--cysteine ligase
MSKRVVLGVTGSIAAYKSAEIVRGLSKNGCEVRCVLTEAASRFVTPLTLSVLSRNPVATQWHDPSLWDMAHLTMATWAVLVVVAPASADFISLLAQGRASGLLDGLILSASAAVAVCPAMDEEMWLHPATQKNIAAIKNYGYQLWGPEKGALASGKVGWGRLLLPEDIVRRSLSLLGKSKKKNVR